MFEQFVISLLVEMLIGLVRVTLVPTLAWIVRQLKALSK